MEDRSGVKDDQGKVEPSFVFEYFPRALEAVSRVSMFGAKKYVRGGWNTVPNGQQRYTDAMLRHCLKEYTEGAYDVTDSQMLHAAQIAWNALARLELLLKGGAPICLHVDVPKKEETLLEESLSPWSEARTKARLYARRNGDVSLKK